MPIDYTLPPPRVRYAVDPLRAELAEDGWFTPDTYDSHIFEDFPSKSGVYLLTIVNISPMRKGAIRRDLVAYAGKSVNLMARHRNHEVVKALYEQMGHHETIVRWWKEVDCQKLEEVEVLLIKKFNPPFNIKHRAKVLYS